MTAHNCTRTHTPNEHITHTHTHTHTHTPAIENNEGFFDHLSPRVRSRADEHLMTLRTELLPIVRHCCVVVRETRTNLPPNEQIEVELRVALEAREFYALFDMLAQRPTTVRALGATKQRDAIHHRSAHGQQSLRARTCYAIEPHTPPLFAVVKRDMLTSPSAVGLGDFELKISAHREIYSDGMWADGKQHDVHIWRVKDRRSFVLIERPAWQIDLTRTVQYRAEDGEANAFVRYELEFELTQEALHGTQTALELVEQLEVVTKLVLGV